MSKDPSKNGGSRVLTTVLPYLLGFSRRPRAVNSAVPGWILLNFELVRALMVVLVTCKNEDDPIKMKALEFSQHYTLFFRCLREANSVDGDGIWQKSKLILCPCYLQE